MCTDDQVELSFSVELFKPRRVDITGKELGGYSEFTKPSFTSLHTLSLRIHTHTHAHTLGFDKGFRKQPNRFEYMSRMSSFIINRRQNDHIIWRTH